MEKATFIIIAFMALMASMVSCDGNNGDDDTDSGTDTDSDTDTDGTCDDVAGILGDAPFRVCFDDSSHSEIPIGIQNAPTALLSKLTGTIESATFDRCTLFAIREGGLNQSEWPVDGDGASVDPDNPTHKSLDGWNVVMAPCNDPTDETGAFNYVVPLKDIKFILPDAFGTVYRWNSETGQMEIVSPTTISSAGLVYKSKQFSNVYVFNRPFEEFELTYVPNGDGGYDINEDGVLVQITKLSDEEQVNTPDWVTFGAKVGDTTLEINPVEGEPSQFRVKFTEPGEHTVTISVRDNSDIYSEETDQHKASVEDTIDLSDLLCAGVTCGTNATCNASDGFCYCDPGYGNEDEDPYVECTDFDACASEPCFDGVTCTDDPAPSMGYTCGDCPDGYTGNGETCDCDNLNGYFDNGSGGCINPCIPDPCGTYGTDCISNDWDDYTCTCMGNWEPSTDCTTCSGNWDIADDCNSCLTGWDYTDNCNSCDTTGGYIENPLDSSECIDDPCLPDPCNGHASSCDVNGPSDYTCNCTDGWTGDDCENPPLPTGSIALDCSGGSAPGWCMSNEHYPLVITSTNADTFLASQLDNCGSDGTFTPISGDVAASPMSIDFVSPCNGSITLQVELCNTTGCIYPTADETIY